MVSCSGLQLGCCRLHSEVGLDALALLKDDWIEHLRTLHLGGAHYLLPKGSVEF